MIIWHIIKNSEKNNNMNGVSDICLACRMLLEIASSANNHPFAVRAQRHDFISSCYILPRSSI